MSFWDTALENYYSTFLKHIYLSIYFCVSRATCSSSHLIMRGQSGRKASRSCRRKVTLALMLSSWPPVLGKLCASPLHVSNFHRKVEVCVAVCFSDLQSCVLSPVELQVLTSSCFKLRTVHNIPVTSNKDGNEFSHKFFFFFVSCFVWLIYSYFSHIQSQT